MYAIARIAGKQFRLELDAKIKVPRLPLEVGAKYEITDILLTSGEGQTQVGQPTVGGVQASATVLGHGREDKIIVHRKKRRKGFRVTKGHRQPYTLLHIESLGESQAKPKARKKKTADKGETEGE